jgi:Domain of unknown function (DUF4145)
MAFNWTCPYCGRDTTINSTYSTNHFDLTIDNASGGQRFISVLIVCPNPKCKKFTLTVRRFEAKFYAHVEPTVSEKVEQTWNLIPPSTAKVFPEYVPQAIRDDYLEACLIRDLSPKASATMSRRCLQGMIRDFWKVSKPKLIQEIEAIKDKVDPMTWKAIDDVRSIGNIGAHMEKDIDVIVDVDADEAQILIELVETLIKDWYVTRNEREQRMAAIATIKAAKDAAKKAPPATPGTTTP